jgi:hypothetical protein
LKAGDAAARQRAAGFARLRSRLLRGTAVAAAVLFVTLVVGIIGFLNFAKMDFPTAFHEAALLLSGMGPQEKLSSETALYFSGIYAMFCGLVLFAAAGILFAPVLHHLFRRYHIEDESDAK